MKKSNYDKFPSVKIEGYLCTTGWVAVAKEVFDVVQGRNEVKTIVAIDTYQGVYTAEIIENLQLQFGRISVFETDNMLKHESEIAELVKDYVTNDPVFGHVSHFDLIYFFDPEKIRNAKNSIEEIKEGIVFIVGPGASLVYSEYDLLIYADMPRWEIQLRFRKNRIGNLGADNPADVFAYQYKRAFYVDWKVLDRHKKTLMGKWDLVLDTTIELVPKMVTGSAINDALIQAVHRPFRVVPFFDPGPWGGQWLKEVCDLDRSAINYAWGFDCVPEENSLIFDFNGQNFEIPSINLVFTHPSELLGDKVFEAFGDEFPIRFDFLDTMEGGNLSLQVHPLHAYMKEKFGMAYTQNESYYFLDAKDDAFVYLGLKEDIVPDNMISDLKKAQDGEMSFDAEKYVEKWPIKKHGHVLIPAGTVHCSGANSVVLEISATPFNFTFKLWDWGRVGMDGQPRPISLQHGENNIQWDRTAQWTGKHLVNHIENIADGDGWKEERTGLDEDSFIETRRHWFSKKVLHDTQGVVNVLNLIEGREAIVESPANAFEPFVIHYAETFIIPAAVGEYTISPYGESKGHEIGTIKAYIRTNNLHNYRIN